MREISRRQLLAGIGGLSAAGLGISGCGSASPGGTGPASGGTGSAGAEPPAATLPTAATLLWRYQAPPGLFGMVPAGDVVCVGIDPTRTQGPGGIYAIDAATGKQAWTQHDDIMLGPFAAGAGAVYCLNIYGLTAVSAATGKVLWNSSHLGIPNPGLAPVLGLYGSGTVYTTAAWAAAADNGVVAVDGQTGRTKWSAGTTVPPSALALGDGVVYTGWYVSDDSGELAALDAATGGRLWTTRLSTVPGHLLVTGGVVVGSTNLAGNLTKFFTFAVDAQTGQLLWQSENRGVLAMAADRGIVWTSPDPLAAWDARTGRQLWQRAGTADQAQLLALSGGVLYTDVYPPLRALSAATGDPLWTRTVTAPSRAHADEGYMAAEGAVVYLGLTNSQDTGSSWIYALRSS